MGGLHGIGIVAVIVTFVDRRTSSARPVGRGGKPRARNSAYLQAVVESYPVSFHLPCAWTTKAQIIGNFSTFRLPLAVFATVHEALHVHIRRRQ